MAEAKSALRWDQAAAAYRLHQTRCYCPMATAPAAEGWTRAIVQQAGSALCEVRRSRLLVSAPVGACTPKRTPNAPLPLAAPQELYTSLAQRLGDTGDELRASDWDTIEER